MRFIAFSASLILAPLLFGHDNIHVHPVLTRYTFESWSAETDSSNLSNIDRISRDWEFNKTALLTRNGQSRPIGGFIHGGNQSDIGWLALGSIDEDDTPRFCNHFYNPIDANAQLTDGINPLDWGIITTTQGDVSDSNTWAATGAGLNISPGPALNGESWPRAREHAYLALTSSAAAVRDSELAHTFYALGKIMHLIQDLSQPDHSRNDMHFFGRYRWIENYGENAVANLTSSANDTLRQRMAAAVPLNLTTTGFTRLRDFWDRDLYTATSGPGPLDQDAQGAITLGLAEYSNGNFLGEDALYFDSSPPDKTFPYPRLSSVSYASSPTFFTLANAAKLKPLALQNGGSTRYALFLEKTRDGVQVDHHSILLYSAVRGAVVRPSKAAKVGYSIQSLDVLKEYHEILLPKAISYSGGLLSYFFRGKLEVASGRDSLGNFIIKVTNKSNQAIKGGSFQIYVEDSNHIRSSGPALTVKKPDGAAWSESSILLHDEFVIAAFTTSNSTDSYRLIYKGTIGVDSNTGVALDVESRHVVRR